MNFPCLNTALLAAVAAILGVTGVLSQERKCTLPVDAFAEEGLTTFIETATKILEEKAGSLSIGDLLDGSVELPGDKRFTLFVPSNEALAAATKGAALDLHITKEIILNHIAPSEITSELLTRTIERVSPTPVNIRSTLPGGILTVTEASGTISLSPAGTDITADIIKSDIETCIGVIHIIDDVLVPEGIVLGDTQAGLTASAPAPTKEPAEEPEEPDEDLEEPDDEIVRGFNPEVEEEPVEDTSLDTDAEEVPVGAGGDEDGAEPAAAPSPTAEAPEEDLFGDYAGDDDYVQAPAPAPASEEAPAPAPEEDEPEDDEPEDDSAVAAGETGAEEEEETAPGIEEATEETAEDDTKTERTSVTGEIESDPAEDAEITQDPEDAAVIGASEDTKVAESQTEGVPAIDTAATTKADDGKCKSIEEAAEDAGLGEFLKAALTVEGAGKDSEILLSYVKATERVPDKDLITVFAPNDGAFQAIEDTLPGSSESMLEIIKNHIAPAMLTEEGIEKAIEEFAPEGLTVRTALWDQLEVSDPDGALVLTPKGTDIAAKVLVADIRTCAGVLHVIDQVLVPSPSNE